MQFTLTKAQIKAMLKFAAVHDVRYYLKGLHIRQNARGTIVESTNGHLLGALRVDATPCKPQSVILGSEHLAAWTKCGKRDADHPVEFYVSDDQTITASCLGVSTSFKALDGRFPDCDRIIPSPVNLGDAKPSNFQTAYLEAFTDAAKILTGKDITLNVFPRGESSAIVDIGHDEFLGILMPLRHQPFAKMPEWVSITAEVKTEETAEA